MVQKILREVTYRRAAYLTRIGHRRRHNNQYCVVNCFNAVSDASGGC